MTHVLVAYATSHGSTREVANGVADTLRARGLDVEVEPAAEVDGLGGQDAVVLGGALYMGRWHRDARRFLKRHRDALATRPLAVFGMGPGTLEEGDVARSRAQLDRALAKQGELHPMSAAIFGGAVNPAELRFPFNHMPASDARDWEAIRAWAESVADGLAST
jgi:menaquinone-dependent protoporphyrinogen oxidase